MPQDDERLAYSPDEFSRSIGGCSKAWLYGQMNSGKLRVVKCGGKTFVPVEEAKRFISDLPFTEFPSRRRGAK